MENSAPSEYFFQIKQEASIYANILFVLDKIESDKHLSLLSANLRKIMESEVSFAVHELNQFQQTIPDLDFHSQLVRNTLIFKENLKLILSSLGNIKSRHSLD